MVGLELLRFSLTFLNFKKVFYPMENIKHIQKSFDQKTDKMFSKSLPFIIWHFSFISEIWW